MKSKAKEHKPSAGEKALNLELSWEKITDIETSLRKLTTSHSTLPLTHETIETLLKFTKEVLRAIEAVKAQEKHYQNMQQSYNMIQSKLVNHDSIVNSLEQHHMQRLKSLSDEIKNSKEYYQKAKKNLQESEEQAKSQYEAIKKENSEIKYKIDSLTKERDELSKQIESQNQAIKQLEEHKERFVLITSEFREAEPKYNEPNLASILCSSIAHKITAYLAPVDIVNLELANKQCRVYLAKSKKVQVTLSNSIIKVKDRKLAYYHRHIDYFEKLYHKIPEEILQTTFYRYQILKENIGSEILNILNSSANLFEGKFQDISDEQFRDRTEDTHAYDKQDTVSIGGITVNIEKEMSNLRDFNSENPHNILEIDEDIVREFLEDRKNSKQKLVQEISYMYGKIKTTAQIYSIDVQSIGKFLTMLLINFSKVFVQSKNLYAEARNLQSLNTLILGQLAHWDKMKVEKNSEIEDLKAQLEAERRLKLFFTNESMKSEQRALAEQNIKLSIESKYLKQAEKLDSLFKEKEELSVKLTECQKDIKNLRSDNKEIRKAYENGKQKYNKIIQELSVVKESILRMNIM